ncbi:hypothetical protein PQQ96_42085, partial [Paraburkholderia sediminicola]|uniref:hypothetical protein n=1 Tax=Paraburkholderia sediminicola TaxID=458836 RepID=UPI0038BB70CD
AWRGQWCIWNQRSRTFGVSDKGVILPAALRAPTRSFIKPAAVFPLNGSSQNHPPHSMQGTSKGSSSYSMPAARRKATCRIRCLRHVAKPPAILDGHGTSHQPVSHIRYPRHFKEQLAVFSA